MVGALARVARRTPAERRLLAHAMLLHAAVATGVFILSIRSLMALLDRLYALDDRRAGPPTDTIDIVLWAAATAAHRWPREGTCLSHAIVARSLLRRIGVDTTLRIGVHRSRGRFAAHAWLERAGEVIVGGGDAFVPIWGC